MTERPTRLAICASGGGTSPMPGSNLRVSAETRRFEADIADVPTRFAHIARRFDLSVIGQFEGDRNHPTTNIVIEAALFESGRPVLIVPFIQKDRLKLDHVMVCWDGSRAAAPAVAAAMPFLTRSVKAT